MADSYQAWSEPRPYREALDADKIAGHLREGVKAGRLDGAAVDAVLRATGHRVRRNREWPAGLTAREVEVLRHLARGMSQKEIAERLVISLGRQQATTSSTSTPRSASPTEQWRVSSRHDTVSSETRRKDGALTPCASTQRFRSVQP